MALSTKPDNTETAAEKSAAVFWEGAYKMEPVCYWVKKIDGDYAILTDTDGEENPVALALLPPGIDEGGRVIWENWSYRLDSSV